MAVDKRALRKSLRSNFNPGPRDYLNRVTLALRMGIHLPAWLMGARLDRPVFIIGAPRSGTSMLFAVMRVHRRLASWPGEAHQVWERDYHPALRRWGSNVLTAADVEPAAAERIRRTFFLATGRRRRLIEKTPRNALRLDFVAALFPDARFVFLKRDGRDNVNSLINAWRTPRYRTYRLPEPHRIDGVDPMWWKFVLYPGWQDDRREQLEVVCARQWVASYENALRFFESLDSRRVIEIRYERLTADPPGEVGRVLEGLGLDYEPAVRAKAEAARTRPVNVVTPPKRGKWRQENRREIEAVLPLIEPTMKELGYVDEL